MIDLCKKYWSFGEPECTHQCERSRYRRRCRRVLTKRSSIRLRYLLQIGVGLPIGTGHEIESW